MVVPSNHRLFFYHFTIRIIVFFLLFLVVHHALGCNGCICPEQCLVQLRQCQTAFPAWCNTPHHSFCLLHLQPQVCAVCCFRNIEFPYRVHVISSMGRCRPVVFRQMQVLGSYHIHSGWPCGSDRSHIPRFPGPAVRPCAGARPLSSAGLDGG